ASTFTPGDDQVGQQVRVQMQYTDLQGTLETITSAATSAIANVNDAPTGTVTISGIGQESYTLTADATAVEDIDGLGAFSYQWQQSIDDGTTWDNITGATGATLVLTAAQAGQRVRATVSYTDGGGTQEVVASDASETIQRFLRGADFNNDQTPDILWRHRTAGETVLWRMEGTNFGGDGSFLTPSVDASWNLAATADLDGDQDADLLWQHQTTGQAAYWIMQGSDLVQGDILPSTGDSGWKLAATGDFNGDGKDDILWRHASSGANAVWLMDGTTLTSGALLETVPDLDWEVGAVGDFTKNGQMEILWQHRLNGDIALWSMNGTTLSGGGILDQVDPLWRLVGAADFSGDAKLDLLWQHRTSGQMAIWEMDGLSRTGASLLSSPPADWQAVI
ncbi:MAG: FG-GAP-like repeat-containing protein, partial [Spirulina sp.]